MSHDAFVRGARLFDAGEFFQAHEAWEERWLVETDAASRRMLQGLIQIAAALHKLVVVRNPESAARLLAKGLAKLDGLDDPIAGAWLVRFCRETRAFASALALGAFDPSAIPKLGV
jgi:predicted metal-dependent hydrolase